MQGSSSSSAWRLIRTLLTFAFVVCGWLSWGAEAHALSDPIVVLVPGFFNSLSTEPNFAQVIQDTIHSRGFDIFVADNLLSVGGLNENGDRLDAYLTQLSTKYPGRQMILFAHSAGGLYTLRALTQHPSLPVTAVVSIGTPYGGVEFINNLTANVPGIETLARFLNLGSLKEFETSKMEPILNSYRVPPGIRWIALAGYQPTCLLATCAMSSHLSWVLTIAQHLMSHSSDGVVTVSSALAENQQIHHIDGTLMPIERWDDFVVPLEHWEMVQEASLFHLLGVIDTDNIRAHQIWTFNTILDRLGFTSTKN